MHTTGRGLMNDNRSYCLLRGRIKEKSSTVFTIKCLVCCFRYQVCCIGNTALWLANTVQLFQLSSATATAHLYGFLTLLKWIFEGYCHT